MKKLSIVIFAVVVLVVVYWLSSPLFIDRKVGEKLEEITSVGEGAPSVVVEGMFVGADDFHKANGAMKVLKTGDKYFVRLEDNFMVTNGPDLFVYFGKNGAYDPNAQIAALKGNIGGQNYEVPVNLNPLDYNEVWIWCRVFVVPFGRAEMRFVL